MLVWPAEVIQMALKLEDYFYANFLREEPYFLSMFYPNTLFHTNCHSSTRSEQDFLVLQLKHLFSLLSAHQLSFHMVTFGIFGR